MTVDFAIYTCAPVPCAGGAPDSTSQDANVWSPLSCTLIYTPQSALLIDCPPSIAAARDLADWVAAKLPPDCTLEYFLPTHAHGDHFFGFPEIQARFPHVQAVASANVVVGITQQYEPEYYDSVWKALFPTTAAGEGLPDEKATFTALPTDNRIDLDGHTIQVVDVGHGDTHAASFVHVSDLDLVVAGDIVYDKDCHQFLGEANDGAKRQQWIEAVDTIARYEPKIVVPGHTFTPMTQSDKNNANDVLNGTKEYINAFQEELDKADNAGDLFDQMKRRYSSRWNLWILNVGCEAGLANKNQTQ